MADTKYTYSIATDTANAKLAADSLAKEIQDSAIITALSNVTALGDVLDVAMKAALTTGDKTILDGVVTAHTGVPLEDDFIQKVEIPSDKPVRNYALAEGSTMRARVIGIFNETLTKDGVRTIDWKIPQLTYNAVNKDSFMDGIQYYACDAVAGDKMTFQIVDVDNILGYGAGTVLDEFGEDWGVMPDTHDTLRLYKAKLIKDLYIRIIYTSTGTASDVKFICNLFRHMDTI